jgi:hypothetical protein
LAVTLPGVAAGRASATAVPASRKLRPAQPATHRGAEKLESATGITLTEIRTMKRPKAIVLSPISRYGRRPPP